MLYRAIQSVLERSEALDAITKLPNFYTYHSRIHVAAKGETVFIFESVASSDISFVVGVNLPRVLARLAKDKSWTSVSGLIIAGLLW